MERGRRSTTRMEGETTLPQFLAAAAVTFVVGQALSIVTERAVNAGLNAGAAVVGPVGRGLFGAMRRGGRAVRVGSARALLGLSRRLEPEGEARLREKAQEAMETARRIGEEAGASAQGPTDVVTAQGGEAER